jgi:hypothetical protein
MLAVAALGCVTDGKYVVDVQRARSADMGGYSRVAASPLMNAELGDLRVPAAAGSSHLSCQAHCRVKEVAAWLAVVSSRCESQYRVPPSPTSSRRGGQTREVSTIQSALERSAKRR